MTFGQIGIVKNPTSFGSTAVFTENQFSSLGVLKFIPTVDGSMLKVGDKITQQIQSNSQSAVGFVASFDNETKVLKYFQDRSAFFNETTFDQTDHEMLPQMLDYMPLKTLQYPTLNLLKRVEVFLVKFIILVVLPQILQEQNLLISELKLLTGSVILR